MIYFDNNATTQMHEKTIEALVKWCNRGNPSAGYAAAVKARAMMQAFRRKIAAMSGGFAVCEEDISAPSCTPGSYKVIFTAGASESTHSSLRASCAPMREQLRSDRILYRRKLSIRACCYYYRAWKRGAKYG